MWILIVLVLIALVVLVLAFVGAFGRFPDNWEWVGIVLAGIGLAMTSPSILQRLCGKPIVKVDFDRGIEDKKRFLLVFLQNPQVKNPILRKLGIKRDSVQSLTVQFRISEFGSGTIIEPIRNAKIYPDDDPTDIGKWRVALAPTFSVGACFIIALWDAQQKKALVPPDRTRQILELSSGYYRVDIIMMIDGEPMHKSRQFVVGEKSDDLIWAQSNK
jgi:hypothetical protein